MDINSAYYSLAYIDDWSDAKDLSRGNTFKDSLKPSLIDYPSGQLIVSFGSNVASAPTNYLFLPMEGSIFDDDPEEGS